MINYDVIRVEKETAELVVINSNVQKRAQNREKTLVETTEDCSDGKVGAC